MTTTTINQSRASIRKLAAAHGWELQPADPKDPHFDAFIRGDRKVHTAWAARGWFDAQAGRFISAFLVDLTVADQSGLDAILDDGGVAKVRSWLKAAV